MNSNDEIFKKIQASLKAAREISGLKKKIESNISEVLSMVSDLTNDAVSYEIIDNPNLHPSYTETDKLIKIFKTSNSYYSFFLCGYSIDEASGYPVTIENSNTIFNCNDDVSLKTTISDLIVQKENSMKIINFVSLGDDIPF